MRLIVYISFLTAFWTTSLAQTASNAQLFADPAEATIELNLNKTLNLSFAKVDDIVSLTNSSHFASYENLATHLTQQFDIEESKVRSIYTWIAMNIAYDQQSLKTNIRKCQSADRVWQDREAVCEGYANLFHEMCNVAGIESRIIKGYVKNFTDGELKFPNHAWNGVKIHGKWQLLDVTWASLNNQRTQLSNSNLQNSYARHKLDHFFLVNPRSMILTHLPEDPFWQLQHNLVHIETFRRGEDEIKNSLLNPYNKEMDFEALISEYEKLDSLDKSIAYLERMEINKWNSAKEYGLGIAYFYKAQQLLKDADPMNDYQARHKAKEYFEKSVEQLNALKVDDYGYKFSRDLAISVNSRLEALQ